MRNLTAFIVYIVNIFFFIAGLVLVIVTVRGRHPANTGTRSSGRRGARHQPARSDRPRNPPPPASASSAPPERARVRLRARGRARDGSPGLPAAADGATRAERARDRVPPLPSAAELLRPTPAPPDAGRVLPSPAARVPCT